MSILRQYFDCFMPELRDFNYYLWVKVIVIYKLVLPVIILILYFLYRDQDETDNWIIITNVILLIIGLENGIGVLSWLISETFSIYTIMFVSLQFFVMLKQTSQNMVDQENNDNTKLQILFCQINEMIYKSCCWLNFATMLPAIFMLTLITVCTCQIKLFQQLIKRNLQLHQEDQFEEYIGDEEIECSICMEEIRQMEKYVQLPCNHIFHLYCIGKWKSYKQLCPVCRRIFKNIQNSKSKRQFQLSNAHKVQI
ncbi:unnamed protein product (macronuclear) [Paramecium tetraurelia]|uniref:RING-type domain-containing protein n=1 Tax=Paramecium tetraurelia TaxID=5888 RepID=A0D8T1_PARTE|nr:uncharacterized protein GSPATT00014394001 [Paramecium tetraurelia]CAK79448.1 unnamed protein product [Paramecium tetraurelia]|eukprot:XP_001446845.1 hypothetical protein (macronuclear) [Paramecium tetraurelia strain d4-2]